MTQRVYPEIVEQLLDGYYERMDKAIREVDWSLQNPSIPLEFLGYDHKAFMKAGQLGPLLARGLVSRLTRSEQVPFVLFTLDATLQWMSILCCEGAEHIYDENPDIADATGAAMTEAFTQLDLEAFDDLAIRRIYHYLLDHSTWGDCSRQRVNDFIESTPAFVPAIEDHQHTEAGQEAYKAKDYQLAVEELSPLRDKLDVFDQELLAHSYRLVGRYEEAIETYRGALPRWNSGCHYSIQSGLVHSYLGLSEWDAAERVLSQELMPMLQEFPLDYQTELAECQKLLGYITARRDSTVSAEAGRPQFSVHSAFESAIEAWTKYDGKRVSRRQIADKVLPDLWTACGYAAGLLAVYRHACSQLGKQEEKFDELRHKYQVLQDESVAQASTFRRVIGGMSARRFDPAPHKARLQQAYPDLPDQAADALANAEWDYEMLQYGRRPSSFLTELGVGIEWVLRLGLVRQMLDYVMRPSSRKAILPSAKDGLCLSRNLQGKKLLNLGQVHPFFEPRNKPSIEPFIITVRPAHLQDWLRNEAWEELRELSRLRNPASHADGVTREDAFAAHELVYGKRLLQRLLQFCG